MAMKKAAPDYDDKGNHSKRPRRQEAAIAASDNSSEDLQGSDGGGTSLLPNRCGDDTTTEFATEVSSSPAESSVAFGGEALSGAICEQEGATIFHAIETISRLGLSLPFFAQAQPALPAFGSPSLPSQMDSSSPLIQSLLNASSSVAPPMPFQLMNSSFNARDLLLRASMLPSPNVPSPAASPPVPLLDAAALDVLNTLQLRLQPSSTPAINQMIADLLRVAPTPAYDRNLALVAPPQAPMNPSGEVAALHQGHSHARRHPPAPPPAIAVAASRPHSSVADRTTVVSVSMACGSDSQVLSEFQCLLRRQVEYFEVGHEDASVPAQGRNKPVRLGQVGIRCVHCAHLPPKRRQRGAVYFPAKLLSIYQSVQNMSVNHFTGGRCMHFPEAVQSELTSLKDKKCYVHGGGKQYWANTAEALGVVESEDGLEFSAAAASY